ncbi:MAG: DUF6288 domain-containing protein [bacterium]
MNALLRSGFALVLAATMLGLPQPCHALAAPPPDLTHGGTPTNAHRWTLGPTGASGWFPSRYLAGGSDNANARQILITEVAKGSPADGVLQSGDVITGLDDQPFTGDARRLFAAAITRAETPAAQGRLRLLRWRAGQTETVTVTLPVLGSYAPTAPFDCDKSARIFQQGCAAIARREFTDRQGRVKISIDNSLSALALLALVASGQAEHRPLVDQYGQSLAAHQPKPGFPESWEYAFHTLFLAEYALFTKDPAALQGLRRSALAIARGASGVGTWGHRFAQENRNLYGYGAMNQPAIPLTLSMVIARQAGIREPEIDDAIDRSARFLRQWVQRGAIPYGDHDAWPWHDDNGKCSAAAVLFDLLGDREAAEFYSRMALAAYDERESGHTGNFFNILWALPGVARCGPSATAAYFRQTAWYYDLARAWDGRVDYVGFPEEGSYKNWDCTGAYLLGYALPLRSLVITGRRPGVLPPLADAQVAETIAAGSEFTFQAAQDQNWYPQRSLDELFAGLASWSPAVRLRSATALSQREGDFIPRLLQLLRDESPTARYGACEALAKLGPKADPAAPQILALLTDKDPWLRILAARAVLHLSPSIRTAAVPELLSAAQMQDPQDPRQRFVGEVAKTLFASAPGSRGPTPILAKSLDGVDRPLLYAAIKKLLANEDGLLRGLAAGVYPRLSADDARALLPEIIAATRHNAPSGEMFRYGIRWAGLDLLARFRIREGMTLAVDIMNEFEWGRDLNRCAQPLKAYGAAARVVLPRLHETIAALRAEGEANRIDAKSVDRDVAIVQALIKDIESAEAAEPVVGAEEFIAKR